MTIRRRRLGRRGNWLNSLSRPRFVTSRRFRWVAAPTKESLFVLAQILSAEAVRIAYRVFLGREPESEEVVENWCKLGSYDALRTAFLNSDEFRAHMEIAPAPTLALVPLNAPRLDIEWEIDPKTSLALLSHVRATWTRLGQERPHWSVLSADEFSPEQISNSSPQFFASGADDCQRLVALLRRHRLAPEQFPRMLEFGCGLARVTPFFARTFRSVVACDVSASHMDIARRVVSSSGAGNVSYSMVQSSEFGMSEPFDLWFSCIVLQHNPPPIIAMILRRCLSLLAPGGVAAFQVPTYALGYRFNTAEYLKGLNAAGGIEMHVLPQPVIFRIARECGCEALEVWQDQAAGNSAAWVSNTFLLRKTVTP